MTLEQKQKAMRARGTPYDGRHRRKQVVTVARTEAEYWENELQRVGLNMNRGENPRLYYWGSTQIVDEIGSRLFYERHTASPVHPKGRGPVYSTTYK